MEQHHFDTLHQWNPLFAKVSRKTISDVFVKLEKICETPGPLQPSLYTPQRTYESSLSAKNRILFRMNVKTEQTIGVAINTTSDAYSNRQRDLAYNTLDRWKHLHNLSVTSTLKAKILFHRIRLTFRRIHKFPLVVGCCMLLAMECQGDFDNKHQNKTYPIQCRFDKAQYRPTHYGKTKKDEWIEVLQRDTERSKT